MISITNIVDCINIIIMFIIMLASTINIKDQPALYCMSKS